MCNPCFASLMAHWSAALGSGILNLYSLYFFQVRNPIIRLYNPAKYSNLDYHSLKNYQTLMIQWKSQDYFFNIVFVEVSQPGNTFLESVYTPKAYRGFESPSLRKNKALQISLMRTVCKAFSLCIYGDFFRLLTINFAPKCSNFAYFCTKVSAMFHQNLFCRTWW